MAQTTDARSLMERARHGAFNQLDAQRERAATGLGSMVGALRESSRQLEGQNATMASYVAGAASQLERFSGGIRDRDVHQIVREVEGFARQRPAIFIGGAFALGLAAARFLKSSGPESEFGQGRYGTGTRSGVSVPSWPTEPLSGPGASTGSTTVTGTGTGLPSATDWGETSREGPALRR